MHIFPDVVHAIGRTPLIRLRRASEETGCEILGKAEFLNPGQSVKDRAALFIIRDGEARGQLRPGGTIVEGTAGNTGIGLATVGNALGYKVVIVIPRTQSEEKKDALRILGARLIEVDPAPSASPNHYVRFSARVAEELNATLPAGAFWANQFDNIANRRAHEETTGPEIWEQTAGRVDGFVCAVGSGGTLGGVSNALKARKKEVAIGIADPFGASLYSWYSSGVLAADGNSIMEGIGQSRVTANLEQVVVDHAFRIADAEALSIVYGLIAEEGLCLGGSSGINIAGAMQLARILGPGKTIVTILCDPGARYQGKIFNREFLAARGLPVPDWLAEPLEAAQ